MYSHRIAEQPRLQNVALQLLHCDHDDQNDDCSDQTSCHRCNEHCYQSGHQCPDDGQKAAQEHQGRDRPGQRYADHHQSEADPDGVGGGDDRGRTHETRQRSE